MGDGRGEGTEMGEKGGDRKGVVCVGGYLLASCLISLFS